MRTHLWRGLARTGVTLVVACSAAAAPDAQTLLACDSGGAPTAGFAPFLAVAITRPLAAAHEARPRPRAFRDAAADPVLKDVVRSPARPSRGPSARSQAGPGSHAVRWGILVGAATGLAISGAAAARYGENEGGRFCAPCFVRWSAVSVPAGAAAGALAGYLIGRAR